MTSDIYIVDYIDVNEIDLDAFSFLEFDDDFVLVQVEAEINFTAGIIYDDPYANEPDTLRESQSLSQKIKELITTENFYTVTIELSYNLENLADFQICSLEISLLDDIGLAISIVEYHFMSD